jgi:anti-anti-sigma factor
MNDKLPGVQCWMEPEDDTVLVHLQGEIDVASAPILADTIAAAFRQRGRAIVDLRDVTYLDASGLRVLKDAAQIHMGHFAVARPSALVRRLIEMVHFGDMIPVMASVQAGRDYLSA